MDFAAKDSGCSESVVPMETGRSGSELAEQMVIVGLDSAAMDFATVKLGSTRATVDRFL